MLHTSNEETGNSVEGKRLLVNKLSMHQTCSVHIFPPLQLPQCPAKVTITQFQEVKFIKIFFFFAITFLLKYGQDKASD